MKRSLEGEARSQNFQKALLRCVYVFVLLFTHPGSDYTANRLQANGILQVAINFILLKETINKLKYSSHNRKSPVRPIAQRWLFKRTMESEEGFNKQLA